MNQYGQTICLNMIVKNEAPVIRRCLDSVRPLIDCWVIVDTGSSDGTQDIIRQHWRDIPGELIERPWVNFAHNRNEALDYAWGRADYIFVIDADETIEIEPGFALPHLTADAYNVMVYYEGISYLRKQLVSSRLPWRYIGVVHEYIHCDRAQPGVFLPGIRTLPHTDGARARDPRTFERDAQLLEAALSKEPFNMRYVFYLAQSYRDAGDLPNAIRHYQRRIELNGWMEEVWYAWYQLGRLREQLEQPWPEVMEAYLSAYQVNPARAEPLYRIGLHYQTKREYAIAHLFFAHALTIPFPPVSSLFIENAIYDYLILVEYAVACFYLGQHDEAIRASNRLLREYKLPATAVEKIVKNRRASLKLIYDTPGMAIPGRLKICIPLTGDSSSEEQLHRCIESLLLQDGQNFSVTLLEHIAGPPTELPADDPRFTRKVCTEPIDDCIRLFLAKDCDPEDIVLLLPAHHCLYGRRVLGKIYEAFYNPGCMAVYGQYVLGSGKPGQAEPAPDETTFRQQGGALRGLSIAAFRAKLRDGLPDSNTDSIASLLDAIQQVASYCGTHFLDDVLTIVHE